MRRSILMLSWAVLALAGCGEPASNMPAGKPVSPVDNTAVNKRDANRDNSLTPIDQKENDKDIQITAAIRRGVLDVSDLSVNARNAKIITADGKVTLRGPVETTAEKEVIGNVAISVVGKDHVENLLEVKEQ